MFQSRSVLAERFLKVPNYDPAKALAAFKVQFPFDLNSVLQIQYSFDSLKQTLEYLAQGQYMQTMIMEQFAK